MICHRDRTFCASSGRCARTDCHRWLDFAPDYDLPVCLSQFRDTEECPGYVQHPILTKLEGICSPKS